MKKMSSLSLLEILNAALLLTKELVQKETMPQSQKAEILKKIVSKIKAIYLLANTPVFSSQFSGWALEFEPIKLLRVSPILSMFERAEWFKYVEEWRKKEYGERGILLYNGLEPYLGEELFEEEPGYEIWLLRTGRFLHLKTTHYEVKGRQRKFEDFEQYIYTYVWRGEARETADPPELNRDEMLEVTSRVTYAISQILSTLKKVDESQQELLLDVLSNLSWHESYFYTKFLKRGISPRDVDWGKSIQPVIDKLVKHLSPKTISGLGQAAITHLLELCTRASPYVVRYETLYPMEYIEELGKNVVEPLVQGLKNRHPGVRKVAAVWLGVIGDKEVSEPLIEALKDEDEWVSLAAVHALGKIGDERAIEPLRQALEQCRFYYQRKCVADAIGTIDQTAIEPYVVMFKRAIEKSDLDKARKVITGLEKIGNEKAADLLIQYFLNEKVHPHVYTSRFIRIDLARSLGRVGTEKAIEALIYVYKKEKKKSVRGMEEEICEVLDQLGKRPKSMLEKLLRR